MDQASVSMTGLWAGLRANKLRLVHELRGRARAVLADPDDRAAWDEIHTIAHRLGDSLGPLGQPAARDAMAALAELTWQVSHPDRQLAGRVVTLVDAAEAAMGRAPVRVGR